MKKLLILLILASCANKPICQGTPLEIQVCQQEQQINKLKRQQAYQAQQIYNHNFQMQQQRANAQSVRIRMGGY